MSEDLRNRFNDRRAGDEGDEEPDEPAGTETETHEEQSAEINKERPSTDAEEKNESGPESVPVRERNQVTMYLSDKRQDAISQLHEEANARSVLADRGEIPKNEDFYPALVDFVTDEYRSEFMAYLGLKEDEI